MLRDAPFPAWVRLEQVRSDVLEQDSAHPEELAALSSGAVSKRKNEFSMGRIAARRALKSIGKIDFPVLPQPDRSPTWPPGVIGSITHSADYAAAVVARECDCIALGIDVEPVRPLRHDIIEYVTVQEERLWVGSDAARLLSVFSAKEAIFKAFYRFKQAYFGFDAVRLEATDGGFDATLLMPLGRFESGTRFFVHAGLREGCAWSAIWLNAPERPVTQS